MKLLDVNILIYAHRKDQKFHAFYRNWLESAIDRGESIGITPLVALGFVRIVTHVRYPNGPTPVIQALAVMDNILTNHHCHMISSGRRHWEIASKLCRETGCQGKLVADAQHAAIAIENACEWVTRDEDFVKFQPHGLRLELVKPVA